MSKLILIVFSLMVSTTIFSQKAIKIQVINTGTYNVSKKTWTWGEPKKVSGFSVVISKDQVIFYSETKTNTGNYTEAFKVISTEVIDKLADRTNTKIILHDKKGEKLIMGLCDYTSEDVMDEIVVLTGNTSIKYFVIF